MADKEFEVKEVLGVLAKSIREKIDAYAEELVALRKRELAKSTKAKVKKMETVGGDTSDDANSSMAMSEKADEAICKLCGELESKCKCGDMEKYAKNEMCGPDYAKGEMSAEERDREGLVAKPAKGVLPDDKKAKAEKPEGSGGETKKLGKSNIPGLKKQSIAPGTVLDIKSIASNPTAKPKLPKLPKPTGGVKTMAERVASGMGTGGIKEPKAAAPKAPAMKPPAAGAGTPSPVADKK